MKKEGHNSLKIDSHNFVSSMLLEDVKAEKKPDKKIITLDRFLKIRGEEYYKNKHMGHKFSSAFNALVIKSR